MARQFTLSTFLRQTPNELLEEYFQERELLNDVDFDDLKKREYQPVMDAIEALSDDQRVEIDQDFQDVYALANKPGTIIIIDEAEFLGMDIADELEAMENHYHRAMWLFLNRMYDGTDVFDICANLAHLKKMPFSKAKRCNSLPTKKPSFDDVTLKNFGDELSALYKYQGRGHKCKVEYCPRPNPMRHCYFAFPEDYSTSELQYEGDKLERKPRKSVFEVAFIFTPEDGVLEVSNPGNKQEAKALQDVFCRVALKLPGLPEKARVHKYNFEMFKDRDCAFPTNGGDGIHKVEVLGLRINNPNNLKRRITIDQDPGSGESVYDWMDRTLDEKKISLDRMDISQVKMRVTWKAVNGSKPRTLTFTLTNPDSTSLQDLPNHQVVKGYLKEWKITN
jgi:hypothetical protein